jgi:hypothetical protein
MADIRIPPLPQTRVVELTRIRRERMLPRPGDVIANVGTRVNPVDVIARAPGQGTFRPVPLARYMRLSPATLSKHMLKQPGDPIAPREIIVSKPELFGTLQRIYRAPGAGRITALQGTWLTMELAGGTTELKALYRGVVVQVMRDMGLVVEAIGSLVQGVWGGGGEGYGVLKVMGDGPDFILTRDHVDVSMRGAVLLVGTSATEDALQRAAGEHIAGVIVGGLDARLRELVHTLGLPTIVTDGMGERCMAPPIFNLLASHDGEETSMNTAFRIRGGSVRPEIFIPAARMGVPAQEVALLAPLSAEIGAQVRIVEGLVAGAVGRIANVPATPQWLESGISTWGAQVEISGGKKLFVPWANLELIG